MTTQIKCWVEGAPETMLALDCADPLESYWPVRFAVDEYIEKSALAEGTKICVELAPGRHETWIVRERRLNETRVLLFGERERKT